VSAGCTTRSRSSPTRWLISGTTARADPAVGRTGEILMGAARRDPACPRHLQIAPEWGQITVPGRKSLLLFRIISGPSPC
jgi:hypothetical protein